MLSGRSKKEYAKEAQAVAEGGEEAAPAADEPTPIRGRKSASTPESDVEEVEHLFYSHRVSYVGRDIFQTKIDCSCGAEVTIAQYREHMIRRHCNVEGCSERALRTVSFGFRDPQFRIIGVPMGICRRHEHSIGMGRMHVIVDPARSRD